MVEHTLRSAIKTDFANAAWKQRLALAAVGFWLAYEWGPGNESVTPWLLVNVLGANDGAISIPITTAVGFAFTFAQQFAAGFSALVAFSMFELTAQAAWRALQRRESNLPQWDDLGWGASAPPGRHV
jgi:hypothetical protein